jgi:hypothetical protein
VLRVERLQLGEGVVVAPVEVPPRDVVDEPVLVVVDPVRERVDQVGGVEHAVGRVHPGGGVYPRILRVVEQVEDPVAVQVAVGDRVPLRVLRHRQLGRVEEYLGAKLVLLPHHPGIEDRHRDVEASGGVAQRPIQSDPGAHPQLHRPDRVAGVLRDPANQLPGLEVIGAGLQVVLTAVREGPHRIGESGGQRQKQGKEHVHPGEGREAYLVRGRAPARNHRRGRLSIRRATSFRISFRRSRAQAVPWASP